MSTVGQTYVFCCLVGAETCRIFCRRCLPLCRSIPRHFWDARFSDRSSPERFSDIATADTALTSRDYSPAPFTIYIKKINRSLRYFTIASLPSRFVCRNRKLKSSFTQFSKIVKLDLD